MSRGPWKRRRLDAFTDSAGRLVRVSLERPRTLVFTKWNKPVRVDVQKLYAAIQAPEDCQAVVDEVLAAARGMRRWSHVLADDPNQLDFWKQPQSKPELVGQGGRP